MSSPFESGFDGAPFLNERVVGWSPQRSVCRGIWWHCRGGDGDRHGAEHDRARSEGIGRKMSVPSGFGGRGRRKPAICKDPTLLPDSRGVCRTNDPRGSGIAVAVDLQERAPAGAGAAGAGPPSEPHPGGRTAQCGGLQLQSQPQDQGGRQPPRPGCAV